ncbi:MAG: pyridoxal-dependent decarboxylase [Phycisphaerales bacterium]
MTASAHMSPDEFRRLGRDIVDRIATYMETVEGRAILPDVEPGDIGRLLPDEPPSEGETWDAILADIDRVIMPGLTHWQSPRFFGYFPANSSFPAILGDLLCTGLGVQGMLWQTSPACTEVETRVMDWLGGMIGLPDSFLAGASGGSGGGVIQGTASEATLTALAAARRRAERAGDVANPVAYCSTQAHSSMVKAAMIAGLGREGMRAVPVDDDLAMDPAALREMIASDRAAGRTPILVGATIGTTSTTAIDPLRAIGEIAQNEGVWLHVDAAYAGAACVCPEFRWMIDGVEHADSFVFNPHKWLLTNFDLSAFWTRDRSGLIDAMSITPEYLRNKASDSGAVIDYRDWHIPLGRRFRAIKLWFVIRHYGVEGLRTYIREHVRLAEVFEGLVRADERFEIVAPRPLSLVCFRLRGEDDRTMDLMHRINDSGRAYLTHTRVPVGGEDRVVLRMAIGATSTLESHVRETWDLITAAASDIDDAAGRS